MHKHVYCTNHRHIEHMLSITIIRWYLVCAYEKKKGRYNQMSRSSFDPFWTRLETQTLTGELPRVSPDKVDPRASYVSHI